MRMAQESQLDLVEVAPKANPPVCRVMDFGKFLYELTKKEKQARKKQHSASLKEIQVRPRIFEHDLEIKLNHARKFFEKKHKVRFVLRYRGREMQYFESGQELLKQIEELLKDVAKPETPPRVENRRISQIFAPQKSAGKKKKEEDEDAKTEETENE